MEVADEQVANRQYMQILERKGAQQTPIIVSKSAKWTGYGLPKPVAPVLGPLVGRVGLDHADDLIGSTSFYIGPWHVEDGGLTVFSWAAPVAAAFYKNGDHDLVGDVVIRRTMVVGHPSLAIDDFFDECEGVLPATSPFQSAPSLSVPKPPLAAARPRLVEPPVPASQIDRPSDAIPVTRPTPAKASQRPLRAAEAVKAALAAPRGTSLPTLLGTLQPDQYDFVTRPMDPSLVIQGHPGTGKTVIAAHRAAYLVHPERKLEGPKLRILILGPNDQYATHVAGVLTALTVDQPYLAVMGLGRFLVRRRQIKQMMDGQLDGQHFDVDNELSYVIDAAAQLLIEEKRFAATSPESAGEAVYEAIRANAVGGIPLTEDVDLSRYLRTLPRWRVAVGQRRYLPMTAHCVLSALPQTSRVYDHIIIDEAQDVRPLEWRLLSKFNPRKSWTILGDMNQRRSDWSYHSWDHVGRDLGLVEDGQQLSVDTFTRGYRSTAPIITYAGHLLPRAERRVDSVQSNGPAPRVFKCRLSDLVSGTVSVALDLHRRHATGTTAVISVEVASLQKHLVGNGWKQDPVDKRQFALGSKTLFLLGPETARGLEFDAVVVMEPLDFPVNLGRFGPLYTSLTRANRELAVTHAKALPDGLRNQGLASKIGDLSTIAG